MLSRHWESFYVILGSSAAVFIGLQFVVMTLLATSSQARSIATMRSAGASSVPHFVASFLIAAFMSAPWEALGTRTIADVCVVSGILGLLYVGFAWRRSRRWEFRHDAAGWLWYLAMPAALHLGLALSGFGMRMRAPQAPFVLGGVALSLLLLGIRNALQAIAVVAGLHQRDASPQPPPEV